MKCRVFEKIRRENASASVIAQVCVNANAVNFKKYQKLLALTIMHSSLIKTLHLRLYVSSLFMSAKHTEFLRLKGADEITIIRVGAVTGRR